ncbi:hypothetical protein GRJ2_003270100 [Grus japonensis]|uniref:Uncharacterized protein n=1 Tax=Grus japonensis TaxID=30415 RepID=A0ABC9YF13_GRUJA
MGVAASNPGKLTHHQIEGCLAYPNENQQLLALYWGLAHAYRATVQYSQRTVVEAGTQTASEDALVEIGTQTTTTVIASVVKKKQWTRRTGSPYHRLVREEEEEEERFDQEAGPSAKKWEEGVREIRQEAETTQSLTSSELRDMWKDYGCQPGKWTTADEGIQYLRELAVLEVLHSDLDDDEVSKDPEDVLCTWAMWRKVIQSAPVSYSNIFAVMYYPDLDTPTVEKVSSWLQNFEENLCTSSPLWASVLAVRGTPRNQSSPAPVRGKGSPRFMPHGALWFFLRDQGEDVRKWDGEFTFKLEARICELRGKTAVKKGSPKKAVSIVAAETQDDNQPSPRHRRTEITSLDPGEGTSGLALQGSDSEYSNQEQE